MCPIVQPDFSEVADEVTPGTYKGIIKGAEMKEWQSGTKYVRWTVETYGEPDQKNNGRRIYHNTALGGRGAFRLQQLYKAATGKPLTGNFDTEELLGKAVELTLVEGVDRDTKEPTGYNEVKTVRRVNEAPGADVPTGF